MAETPATVFTLGYEGADIAGFIAELAANDIACLIDVRAAPYSRKPDFAKASLRRHLAAADIEYRHFVDLGNPKAGREAAARGDTGSYVQVYQDHLDSEPVQLALASVIAMARSMPVCLMCLEADPNRCHRGIIAEYLEREYSLNIRHLRLGGQRQFAF